MPKGRLNGLIEKIKKYNPNARVELVEKAFKFAEKAHKGQKRAGGAPFFTHPFEVAKRLADMKADSATICAALLHDTVEDTSTSIEKIKEEFGEEIANLIEGVTKTEKIQFEDKDAYTSENLRKILLATAKDIRVMLIKLADRLHNMETLKEFREEKQKRIAKETLDIYAPIAHKLGMWSMKGQLEDLSMRYLHHEMYRFLSDKISEKREEREKNTKELIKIIDQKLSARGVDAEVQGRAKYFYSIYKKMVKKKVEFNEIYDLIAIRIVTKTIPECYAALGVLHDLWKPLQKRFKDYIAVPKSNGYQSLHTTLAGPHGKILEVQIRTDDMHTIAEDGIAAHWRYHGTDRDKKFEKKILWLKQLLEWRRTSKDAKEFIESFKIDMFEKEIVVFTPRGDPISLPEGATPIDFAYEVHSSIGDRCSKAKVNDRIVSLDMKLRAGDIIEVMTQKNAEPSRQWLKFAKTNKARNKIRSALNISSEGVSKSSRKDEDELADVSLIERIIIDGKKAPLKISKCCSPTINDEIVGFYTKEGKITVHKDDCPNIHTLDKSKEVKLSWEQEETKEQKILVVAKDRVGILVEVLDVVASSKINIIGVNAKEGKEGTAKIYIDLDPEGLDFSKLVKKMKINKDVVDIKKID